MALVVTATVVGQAVGTGANAGEGLFPQKIALAVGTIKVTLNARLTNGAGPVSSQQRVLIHYIISSISVTAAAAVAQFRNGRRTMELTPGQAASDSVSRNSDTIPNAGGFLYYWVDCPTFPIAGSLDISSAEI